MSSNLPPSFKPIAHYIKIANENASRDPVIYYWSLLCMALGPTSSEFNVASWSRLQSTIRIEKRSIDHRDTLRNLLESPDDETQRLLDSEELSKEILEKTQKCECLREKIAKLQKKIQIGRQEIEEIDEKLEKKEQNEQELEHKVQIYEDVVKQNSEKKAREKRTLSILIRLGSYRKMTLIKDVFDIFRLKIDGGPASSLFYAVQTAMKLDKSSVEARQYLTGLLTTLESIKSQLADNDAIKNETIAQAHIERFAEKLFNFADKKEKAGNIDKSVVHAFYTAGHVMDILSLFGEIDEPFLSSKKYAKWKSTQIFTCLRDGTPYVPSSQEEKDDDDLAQFGAQFQPNAPSSSDGGPQEHAYNQPPPAAPGFGFSGIPNVPSDHSLPPQPPARSTIPPPPPAYSSTPNLPSQVPYPPTTVGRHQPQQYEDFSTPQPIVKPSGNTPTDEEFAEIRKLTKYAMSAVDYEDVKAIRDNLNKALAILQRY